MIRLRFRPTAQRVNFVPNSAASGAVAGSPGTAPTGWNISGAPNGVARSIVGTDVVNGIDYVDVRFNGTATGTGPNTIIMEPTATGVVGEIWNASVYCQLVAGSLTNVSQITLRLGTGVGTIFTLTSDFVRYTQIRLLTATDMTTQLRFNWTATAAVDFTLRIGNPQRELGALVTPPIRTSA